jgi:hypothetical protein
MMPLEKQWRIAPPDRAAANAVARQFGMSGKLFAKYRLTYKKTYDTMPSSSIVEPSRSHSSD